MHLPDPLGPETVLTVGHVSDIPLTYAEVPPRHPFMADFRRGARPHATRNEPTQPQAPETRPSGMQDSGYVSAADNYVHRRAFLLNSPQFNSHLSLAPILLNPQRRPSTLTSTWKAPALGPSYPPAVLSPTEPFASSYLSFRLSSLAQPLHLKKPGDLCAPFRTDRRDEREAEVSTRPVVRCARAHFRPQK